MEVKKLTDLFHAQLYHTLLVNNIPSDAKVKPTYADVLKTIKGFGIYSDDYSIGVFSSFDYLVGGIAVRKFSIARYQQYVALQPTLGTNIGVIEMFVVKKGFSYFDVGKMLFEKAMHTGIFSSNAYIIDTNYYKESKAPYDFVMLIRRLGFQHFMNDIYFYK